MNPFAWFLHRHGSAITRMSRHSQGEYGADDVRQEAWLLGMELADAIPDWNDAAFCEHVLPSLYQQLVRWNERTVRFAVKLDHAPPGMAADGAHPLLDRPCAGYRAAGIAGRGLGRIAWSPRQPDAAAGRAPVDLSLPCLSLFRPAPGHGRTPAGTGSATPVGQCARFVAPPPPPASASTFQGRCWRPSRTVRRRDGGPASIASAGSLPPDGRIRRT